MVARIVSSLLTSSGSEMAAWTCLPKQGRCHYHEKGFTSLQKKKKHYGQRSKKRCLRVPTGTCLSVCLSVKQPPSDHRTRADARNAHIAVHHPRHRHSHESNTHTSKILLFMTPSKASTEPRLFYY